MTKRVTARGLTITLLFIAALVLLMIDIFPAFLALAFAVWLCMMVPGATTKRGRE